MDAPRPGPALEGGDASGVDLDDMDLAAGGALAPGGALVLQRLVEAVAGAGRDEGEAGEAGQPERERPPALHQRLEGPGRHVQNLRCTPSRRRWRSELK
jgi:hypothetical protein